MHELSIANELVKQIEEFAAKNNVESIQEIVVEVGLLRRVVLKALELGFVAASNQTIVEGATLKLVEIKPIAECKICGKTFKPEVHNFLCPDCNKAKVKILQGNEIVLKTIVFNEE